jgi:6-phosphofructokinase 1
LAGETVRGLLPKGGTILARKPRATCSRTDQARRRGRRRGPLDYAVQRIQDLGLEGLILIGGDGTMHIGYGLMQKGVKIVGVPKTIDNDLAGTDVTFGFDTALGVATDALDRLHTTAEAHHREMLLEVMGRNAGWLALHAALAGGCDAVLIPEIPYDIKRVVGKIRERNAAGYRFTIIVVAEGAQSIGGEQVFRHQADDPLLKRLGGVSYRVSEEINSLLPAIEVRTTVLGHVQRGGTPSPSDRILATRYGVAAMDLVAAGQWGRGRAARQEVINIPLKNDRPAGHINCNRSRRRSWDGRGEGELIAAGAVRALPASHRTTATVMPMARAPRCRMVAFQARARWPALNAAVAAATMGAPGSWLAWMINMRANQARTARLVAVTCPSATRMQQPINRRHLRRFQPQWPPKAALSLHDICQHNQPTRPARACGHR